MSASTSGFQKPPGSWEWPDDLPPSTAPETPPTSQPPRSEPPPSSHSHPRPAQPNTARPQRERHWRPRTCRICLDTVLPTFHAASDTLPEMFQGAPYVSYDSDGGRLISPCNCKGSARYVHENCLQQWRHADPSYGKRNYWNCPTCGFRYRLGRISWGHWLSSTVTQIALTVFIFAFAVFALGFVADPIINLYLDPVSTISSLPSYDSNAYEDYDFDDEDAGWIEHFMKGLASLGLLGFVKVFFTMGPWNWFNMRHFLFGGTGGRTGTTGRDRVANISWVVVLLGVIAFLYTVWKLVRAWSRRVLEKASERVMDVHVDNGDDDEDET